MAVTLASVDATHPPTLSYSMLLFPHPCGLPWSASHVYVCVCSNNISLPPTLHIYVASHRLAQTTCHLTHTVFVELLVGLLGIWINEKSRSQIVLITTWINKLGSRQQLKVNKRNSNRCSRSIYVLCPPIGWLVFRYPAGAPGQRPYNVGSTVLVR